MRAGVYTPGDTWLYHLDPRTRLFFGLTSLLLTLVTPLSYLVLILLVVNHILLLFGGVSLERILRFWWTLLPLVLAILILQPVVSGGAGEAVLSVRGLTITEEALHQALGYALKLSGAAFAVFFPLVTTPIHSLIKAVTALGLPYRIGLMLGLALHYLGLLEPLYISILEAQQARGLDFSRGHLLKRARAVFPAMIALIITSLQASDALALSLAARGYGLIDSSRTVFSPLRMQKKDWLFLSANLLLAALLIFTWAGPVGL